MAVRRSGAGVAPRDRLRTSAWTLRTSCSICLTWWPGGSWRSPAVPGGQPTRCDPGTSVGPAQHVLQDVDEFALRLRQDGGDALRPSEALHRAAQVVAPAVAPAVQFAPAGPELVAARPVLFPAGAQLVVADAQRGLCAWPGRHLG